MGAAPVRIRGLCELTPHKWAYASRSEARRARDLMRQKHGEHAGRRLGVYRCPSCELFHLGNRSTRTHRDQMRPGSGRRADDGGIAA